MTPSSPYFQQTPQPSLIAEYVACFSVLQIVGSSFLASPFVFPPKNSGLALSGIETSDWWQDFRFDDNDDWSESHIIVAVIMLVTVAAVIGWHFAEAWRVLPGAYYVSGNINLNIVIKENLHRIYNVSRGLIVTYALLYGAFAFDAKEGFQLHYILLAWVLSLLAQFKCRPSILFLALCTGVFVQGFGSYRLR